MKKANFAVHESLAALLDERKHSITNIQECFGTAFFNLAFRMHSEHQIDVHKDEGFASSPQHYHLPPLSKPLLLPRKSSSPAYHGY